MAALQPEPALPAARVPVRASAPARVVPYVCAAVAIAAGLSVLVVGWGLDVAAMRSIVPGTVSMKPSTALLFVAAGVSLALLIDRPTRRRVRIVRACAVFVIALSLLYLAEYVFDVSFGIDELPFEDTAGRADGVKYPGRPAPLSSISFILLACAILTLDARRRLTEPFVAPVLAIGATCLIGYLYSIPFFYGQASAAKMAINTATVFLVLSAGILLARPRGRLQTLITTASPGGMMLRKLLPVAIAVPLLLGWLELQAHDAGLFNHRVGAWWLAAVTIVCLVLVIVFAARSLDRGVREAQIRFETAFHHAPIGIALVALNGRIMRANRALSDITGYDERSLVGMHVADFLHPDDVADSNAARQRLLTPGTGGHSAERRYIRRDGAELWARHSATLVRDDDGRPLHFITQVQDITRQREVDRLKEEFVAVVTHELRTPLTSVAGYLDIVLEDDDDVAPLAPEHAHHVQVARRNAQRLIDLVEDLLLIRRLEAGREQLTRTELDLSGLAADRLESVAPMASAKGVRIGGDIAPNVIVDADPRRIAQVLDNLLSNAIKYTPEGGDVRLTLTEDASSVALAVNDTGIGIPEAEQSQLFDPFFRASNVSGSAAPGTGLGLVVTRRLIEAHGGKVGLESAPGSGSRFVVTLPATSARAPDRDSAGAAA